MEFSVTGEENRMGVFLQSSQRNENKKSGKWLNEFFTQKMGHEGTKRSLNYFVYFHNANSKVTICYHSKNLQKNMGRLFSPKISWPIYFFLHKLEKKHFIQNNSRQITSNLTTLPFYSLNHADKAFKLRLFFGKGIGNVKYLSSSNIASAEINASMSENIANCLKLNIQDKLAVFSYEKHPKMASDPTIPYCLTHCVLHIARFLLLFHCSNPTSY